MSREMLDFATPFRTLRRCMGLSQVRMARELNCSQPTVSKIESGDLEPAGAVVVRAGFMARRVRLNKEVRKQAEPIFKTMGWV